MTAREVNCQQFEVFCAETGRDVGGFVETVLGAKTEPGRVHCVSAFTPPAGTAFVVKTIVLPDDEDMFRKKMRNHRRAFNAGASVPRIYWVYPDTRTVIMEGIEGTRGDLALGQDPLHSLRRAGTWIGDFHRRSNPAERAFQPRFMMKHIARLIGEAHKRKRRIPRLRRFEEHFASLERFADAARDAPVMSVANHGDFHPGNLILGDKRVWGIDLAAFNTAPVVYDLSRFLIAAQIAVAPQGWSTQSVLAPEPLQAFVTGYGEISAEDPVLQFLLRARVLIDWAALHDSPMSLKKHRRLWALRRAADFAF